MSKQILRAAIAVFFLCTSTSLLPGWNSEGHMAVAYVAYLRLQPGTKQRAIALLKLNPYYANKWSKMIPRGTSDADYQEMIFMIAATWPDEIKQDPNYKDDGTQDGDKPDGPVSSQNIGYTDTLRHKYWHFVDMPFSQDGTALNGPTRPNAETQIVVFRKVLSGNGNDALKSYDVVWLMHLVGDVHQPLHCTSRFSEQLPDGDAGANLVELNPDPSKNELHAFWDDILGTSNDPVSAMHVGEGLPSPDATMAGDINVDDWISESFQDAKTDVYILPIGPGKGPFTLTPQYEAAARQVASQRIALAGVRLANVLNNELK
jgi:hypothetical protein